MAKPISMPPTEAELSAFRLIISNYEYIDKAEWHLDDFKNKQDDVHLYEKVQSMYQTAKQNFASLSQICSKTDAYRTHREHSENKLKHLENKLVTLKPAGYTVSNETFIGKVPGGFIMPTITSIGTSSPSSSGNGSGNKPQLFVSPPAPTNIPFASSPSPIPQKTGISPPVSTQNPSLTPTPSPVNNNTQPLGLGSNLYAIKPQLFVSPPAPTNIPFASSPSPIPQNPAGSHQVNTPTPTPLSFNNSPSSAQDPEKDDFVPDNAWVNHGTQCIHIGPMTGSQTAGLSNAQILERASYFFRNGNNQQALEELKSLPNSTKGEIQEALWIVRGRPQGHPDFGDASLWDKDPACYSSPQQKGSAVEAVRIPVELGDMNYKTKVNALLDKIVAKQGVWNGIDHSRVPGAQKNNAKKETLHQLAQEIVPQFMHKENVIRQSPRGRDSYHSLALAYIYQYPCLRPFFFTLFLNEGGHGGPLQIPSEILPVNPMTPKPSQALAPNLAAMDEQAQKNYHKGIMAGTMATLNAGFYINSNGEQVTLDLKPSIGSLHCQTKSGGVYRRPGTHKTQISLEKADYITLAGKCARNDANVAVFVPASGNRFGGGYKTGARAGEEDFCYRSGLCKAVDQDEGAKANHYPLTNHAVLNVDRVPVIRGEEKDGYPYLNEPFEVSALLTAGYDFNEEHQQKQGVASQDIRRLVSDQSTGELRLPPAEAFETMQKLRTSLHLAAKKGYDVLVVPAPFCGAYCNPPKQIFEMFLELITKEFPNSFSEIIFSIRDDHNTGKAHNPQGNYQVCKETFEKNKAALQTIGATFKVNS